MRQEKITDKEAIFLLITFYIGSSIIIGVDGESNNDAWISGIIGLVMAVPIIFVYSRILSLFPGYSLFDIVELVFGKIIGKIVTLFYIWYSFHLGALVIRNFGEFINTIAMPETPLFVTMFFLTIVCIFAVISGIEVIGRISASVLPILFFILFAVYLMSIPKMNLHFIKPILGSGFPLVIKGGFSAFSFPFAESVIFMGAFYSLKTKKSTYKVYLIGTAIAGLLIIAITFRSIVILGQTFTNFYFPTYIAVSLVNLGDFLQRIELTVSVVFVFGVFIKSSICLMVTCKGIAKLFNLQDYRSIVIQVGLLMLYLSYIIYDSIMEMKNWAFQAYPYYAFPFQVILPLILLITAEIKTRKTKMATE